MGGFSSLNPLNDLSDGFRDAVTSFVDTVGNLLQKSTNINFSPHYTELIHTDVVLTSISALIVLLFQAGHAAITNNLKILGSAVINSMLAILMGSILIVIVPLINYIVNVFSDAVMTSTLKNSFTSNNGMFHLGFITPLATGQPIGNNPELVIVFGFLIIIAAGICYVMLLMAAAVGYITLFFTPLAWSVSPKAGRKMLEVTIFILFAPFFITCSLAIATSLMTGSLYNGIAALGQILIGIALLFVSAFSPFIIFRMLPLTHAASLTGAHESIKHVGASAKRHVTKAASLISGSPKGAASPVMKDNFRKDAALGGLSAAATGGAAATAMATTHNSKQSSNGTGKSSGSGAASSGAAASGAAKPGGSHNSNGSGKSSGSGAAASGAAKPSTSGATASGAAPSRGTSSPGGYASGDGGAAKPSPSGATTSGAAKPGGSHNSNGTGKSSGSGAAPSGAAKPSTSGATASGAAASRGTSSPGGSSSGESKREDQAPKHINREKFKDV